MFKHRRLFAFGLVFLGLAVLCGVFLVARPAWAQCSNLGCNSTPAGTCDQSQSGSCPWCVPAGIGTSCTGQGLSTIGTGNTWYGSIPVVGSNVTYKQIVCLKAASCTFVKNETGFCYYLCLEGIDTCQDCKLGSWSNYTYVTDCESHACTGGNS